VKGVVEFFFEEGFAKRATLYTDFQVFVKRALS
jgi:hypothetical protein